jgi:putative alpha-1,2-mannosidase
VLRCLLFCLEVSVRPPSRIKLSTNLNPRTFSERDTTDQLIGPIDDVIATVTQLGTLLTFAPNPNSNKPTSILARVGVSFISPEQACSNAESEIPDFDFAGTQASARAQWNELLSRVQVSTEGVYKEIVELFYSSVGFLGVLICTDWVCWARADRDLFVGRCLAL